MYCPIELSRYVHSIHAISIPHLLYLSLYFHTYMTVSWIRPNGIISLSSNSLISILWQGCRYLVVYIRMCQVVSSLWSTPLLWYICISCYYHVTWYLYHYCFILLFLCWLWSYFVTLLLLYSYLIINPVKTTCKLMSINALLPHIHILSRVNVYVTRCIH